MKTAIIIFLLACVLYSCNSDNHPRSEKSISLVKEPPTYIKDRQLYGAIEKSVDPQGAEGPGSGGSYASGFYRRSTLKASAKMQTQPEFPDSAKANSKAKRPYSYFPPNNEANNNYIDRWDRSLINKYDQPGSLPDTRSLSNCTWHPPLKVNMGSGKFGEMCALK